MISVQNLHHTFKIGKKGSEKTVPVLKGINLTVEAGEIVSILGKSGSGKSTLLQAMAGLMKPNEGAIYMNNKNIVPLSESEMAKFRLENFGFIFQNFQLLPNQNVFENIEIPLKLKGFSKVIRKAKVEEMMYKVGLDHVADHYPNELSGGQQQRVAIARAMITGSPVIFADEPTGSLDMQTEQEILLLIQMLNQKESLTFVIITHDEEVASIAHTTYRMHDGLLKGEERYAI